MSAAYDEGPTEARYDPEAETALLAACMHSKTARQQAKLHLSGPDFYLPQHERIWDAMMDLDRAGKGVDATTVHALVGMELGMPQVMIQVASHPGLPDNVADYASIVRGWSVRRAIGTAAQGLLQRAHDSRMNPAGLAAKAVSVFQGIRDSSDSDALSSVRSMRELMDQEDDTPEWVIPGLLERGDRLMLTGTEGAGKSALSRQLGIMAAAGLHPFDEGIIPPIKVAIIDCENKESQVRRQSRPLLTWLREHGTGSRNPLDHIMVDTCGRIDLTRDRDLSRIHQLLDAQQPDLVIIGPIYKTVPRALQTDDEAAPLLAALDTIMERGCALIIEAHAGHGASAGGGRVNVRDLRPRGSAALLGWPEFGLGLRAYPDGIADLAPWRGGRERRDWPPRLKRAAGNRWIPTMDGVV